MLRESAAQMLQAQAKLGPRGLKGELFAPFEDDDGGLSKHFFQAESLKIVEALDAIKVAVENFVATAIFVDEREGWAGDFVLGGGVEAGNDALGERGFAAAKFTRTKAQ